MSQDVSQNNKRLAKNTLFLYFRVMLTMFVALFTSRILLNALGVDDYGLNNVVAGVIVLFSFLNGALGQSTSRFLTFELGNKDTSIEKLRDVFRTAFNIHGALAIIVVVFCETVGLWVVNYVLVIPPERLFACNIIYQFTVASALLSITQVPLLATIISHERMSVYAFLGIFDAVFKSIVAYAITVSSFDKLITLGTLNFGVTIITYIIYHLYNKKYFQEYNFGIKVNRNLFREMLGYSVWSLTGATAFMLKTQGVNVLINIFFGPVVNAANAIAYQVSTAVTNFSNSFTTSLNPQITKSYAANNIDQMKNLIYKGGRFSFFLLMMMVIPLILETDFILRLWLRTVPQYAVDLTRLILLLALVESFAITISVGIQATGKIKYYQIIVGCIYLLNFPITYLAYTWGAVPSVALIISIILSFVNIFTRLYFIKSYISGDYTDYLLNVISVSFLVLVVSIIPPLGVYWYMEQGILRLLSVLIVSLLSSGVFIYFLGLKKTERQRINLFIKRKIKTKL